MTARFAVLGALLVLAGACSDEKRDQQRNGLTTSPNAPRLSMKNLPPNASTICIANIRKRDEILLKNAAANHDALDAAIADVCE